MNLSCFHLIIQGIWKMHIKGISQMWFHFHLLLLIASERNGDEKKNGDFDICMHYLLLNLLTVIISDMCVLLKFLYTLQVLLGPTIY